MRPLLSICIPSFNRPRSLSELLYSIDCDPMKIEIVICEDCSNQREEIKSAVIDFSRQSSYDVKYFENISNLGYDCNIRKLVEVASGRFVIFMGDDDLFIPKSLNHFLDFIQENGNIKYILRSYIAIHSNGNIENFRYLKKSVVLPAGIKTVAWLFKRSVCISGFTISREDALIYATNKLDGTLLYQVYLMAQVCFLNESVYCDFPVAQAIQSFRKDEAMFGSSESERNRYTPGKRTIDNSINFSKAYFELTKYIDDQHKTNLTELVKIDLSKYSYPFLSIQRRNGISDFLKYAKRLEKELGFGCTSYFYLYKWGLVLFGEYFCDRLIRLIKRLNGFTPNF